MGNWFSLPLMRDRYCSLLDQIEMGSVIGFSTKSLEAECWQIRKESYKILAKLRDEGQLVKSAAAVFGWSLEQLDSEVLREWLCKSEGPENFSPEPSAYPMRPLAGPSTALRSNAMRSPAMETDHSAFSPGGQAAKSERTPVVSTQHSPLGSQGLWHTPSRRVPEKQQLPAYIQNTAKALMRDGMEESEAIATAVNAVKAWASGSAFGGKVKVTDEVRQAAQRALQEWNDLKASHHG